MHQIRVKFFGLLPKLDELAGLLSALSGPPVRFKMLRRGASLRTFAANAKPCMAELTLCGQSCHLGTFDQRPLLIKSLGPMKANKVLTFVPEPLGDCFIQNIRSNFRVTDGPA